MTDFETILRSSEYMSTLSCSQLIELEDEFADLLVEIRTGIAALNQLMLALQVYASNRRARRDTPQ